MTIQLGQVAPDFEQDTTQGRIRFHEWLDGHWGVLFSHPKDFTPVCTTELGETARLKPEFDRRNVKVIGLSVDNAQNHEAWNKDIEETQGYAVNFPMIIDSDRKVRYSLRHDPSRGRPEPDRAHRLCHGPAEENPHDAGLSAERRAQLRRDPAGH